MHISYISDIHADFYVHNNANQEKFDRNTRQFILDLIGTDSSNKEVIIVAGDISHYNKQSLIILEVLSQHYDQVFYLLGNHDYYLVTNSQIKKYKNSSQRRVDELIAESIKLNTNITPLYDDIVHDYKGVKFAGLTMWYPLETLEQQMFFRNNSNDSVYIKGFDIAKAYHRDQKYYEALLIKHVDIMVSHVPVINIDSHFKYNSTACYLTLLKDLKVSSWIMGHSHEQKAYKKPYANFYMNAIGYPNEDKSLIKSIKWFEFKKGVN